MNRPLSIILLLALWSLAHAQEPKNPRVRDLIKEVSRSKKKLEEQAQEQRKVLSSLYGINQKLKKMANERADLSDRVYGAQGEVKSLARLIARQEVSLEGQRDQLARRLTAMSRLSSESTLRIIFSRASGNDIDQSLKFLKLISKQHKEVIENYLLRIEALRKKRERLTQKVKQLVQLQEALHNQEQDLAAEQNSKAELLGGLRLKRKAQLRSIRALRRQGVVLTKKHKALESLLRPSFYEKRGALQHPAEGEIWREYGVIYNNEFRYNLRHKGLFIATPAKALVQAVFEGSVKFSGQVPVLGKIVMLDHGDHYYTVYSNLDKVKVEQGQQVEAGDNLGLVSYSDLENKTGLYFEIRHFSDAIDPEPWLKEGYEVVINN